MNFEILVCEDTTRSSRLFYVIGHNQVKVETYSITEIDIMKIYETQKFHMFATNTNNRLVKNYFFLSNIFCMYKNETNPSQMTASKRIFLKNFNRHN